MSTVIGLPAVYDVEALYAVLAAQPALRVAYRLPTTGEPVSVAPLPTSDGQKHNVGIWTPPSDAHWLFPLRWERSAWERPERREERRH